VGYSVVQTSSDADTIPIFRYRDPSVTEYSRLNKNLVNCGHHRSEFSACEDRRHDASHGLPFFASHRRQHAADILVGLLAQLDRSSIDEMVEVFHQDVFRNLQISNYQKPRAESAVSSDHLLKERNILTFFLVYIDRLPNITERKKFESLYQSLNTNLREIV
jgi:hypothetical protein